MRKFIYLLLLLSFSCGSKTAFTTKQYSDLHFKTRHDHVDLIQHSSPTIDTMLQTMVNMIEEDMDQEECLRYWHKTKTFIHEAEMQNQIYASQMILTEDTKPLHTEIWNSHNRIVGLESDLGYDIELAVRSNDRDKAMLRLKDMKVLMAREWSISLNAALEYIQVAFGEQKK